MTNYLWSRLGPRYPVIPVEIGPFLTGGDTREGVLENRIHAMRLAEAWQARFDRVGSCPSSGTQPLHRRMPEVS